MEILLKTPSQTDNISRTFDNSFLFFRFVSSEKRDPHLLHLTEVFEGKKQIHLVETSAFIICSNSVQTSWFWDENII